jgi:hypothetical protein
VKAGLCLIRPRLLKIIVLCDPELNLRQIPLWFIFANRNFCATATKRPSFLSFIQPCTQCVWQLASRARVNKRFIPHSGCLVNYVIVVHHSLPSVRPSVRPSRHAQTVMSPHALGHVPKSIRVGSRGFFPNAILTTQTSPTASLLPPSSATVAANGRTVGLRREVISVPISCHTRTSLWLTS